MRSKIAWKPSTISVSSGISNSSILVFLIRGFKSLRISEIVTRYIQDNSRLFPPDTSPACIDVFALTISFSIK
jgi:hypothetical protein